MLVSREVLEHNLMTLKYNYIQLDVFTILQLIKQYSEGNWNPEGLVPLILNLVGHFSKL